MVRAEGTLDVRTRLVHVVARVEDPYGLESGAPPLEVGLFVEAEIEGREIASAVRLPRGALRGDGEVVVVDADCGAAHPARRGAPHRRRDGLRGERARGRRARRRARPEHLRGRHAGAGEAEQPAARGLRGDRAVNGAIAWFARNSVATNLLMWAMLIGGLLAWPTLRQEMFPDIDLEVVTVTAPYPGAAPAEVEEALVTRIEEAVHGLPGVKRVRSTAAEGVASVSIELHSGEDVARRMADIRARVDAIESWPEEAERPRVAQAEFPRHVLSIAVWGDADERTLKRLAEQARDELSALPEISEVSLASVRPDEIAIEVSDAALLPLRPHLRRGGRRGARLVARPARRLGPRGGRRDPAARQGPRGRRRSPSRSCRCIVRPDGSRVLLGDVARVVDGFAETDQRATFDGKPAVLVTVMSVGDQKAIEVARAATAWVEAEQARLPAGVAVTVWQDMSGYLAERLDSLFSNAWGGFAMVFVVLALLLRLRLAFWVALGVPTAFLGAVAVMPLLGVTINWISLLGFLVVLGILVDDAIVVGENTYTEQRRSGNMLEGAIRGAQGIAVPVVFGVLTTVAAFAPMLFIPGAMGRLVIGLPLVVIACLMFSLFEAMFILPAHLAAGKSFDTPPTHPISKRWRAIQDRVVAAFESAVERGYRPLLQRALEWRYTTLALAVGVAIVVATLVGSGWLRFVFQEPVEGDLMIADLTMEPGTPAEVTAAAVRALEQAAFPCGPRPTPRATSRTAASSPTCSRAWASSRSATCSRRCPAAARGAAPARARTSARCRSR